MHNIIMNTYTQLQVREIFHLEFLRFLTRKLRVELFALKGGTNLRFFFRSFRYSEDMDLDIFGVRVDSLKDIVMKILQNLSFKETLEPFGLVEIVPPDISKAKQTQTTQRFKIHIITSSGEDLFTKIEFSRREFKGKVVVETVSDTILRSYKMAPLLVPHYDVESAIMQKIGALATRSIVQARDVFDLYILIPQSHFGDAKLYETEKSQKAKIVDIKNIAKAHDNIFEISFEQFRDTVLSYLVSEDQSVYNSTSVWDEISLKVANFIESLEKNYA